MTDFLEIVGESQEIKKIIEVTKRVASSDATVLINGESGTGKELFARFVHVSSKRVNEKFVPVNCAAIPDNLLENELFGHKKGAFTDANDDYVGKFGFADKGTIFLDEVGEMSISLQTKILRLIQFKEYEPIGDVETVKTDVRIIAATNKDLRKLVKEGKFREDLYYRLNVVPVVLPALRERKGDIEVLANYFLRIYCQKNGKPIDGFSPVVLSIFNNYKWQGNVRELQNVIERAVVLCKSNTIEKKDIYLQDEDNNENSEDEIKSLKKALDEFKKDYIIHCLNKNGWNQTKTAEVLEIQRTYLARLIKDLKIDKI
jgi:Nif-specific regulatory protein